MAAVAFIRRIAENIKRLKLILTLKLTVNHLTMSMIRTKPNLKLKITFQQIHPKQQKKRQPSPILLNQLLLIKIRIRAN